MAQANVKAVITAEDRASRVVQGFGGSIKSMAASVAIGQLAVQGINRAISTFTDMSKNILQSATDFQQSRIAFETMLGSADKAKQMLKEVSDFAAKTPFELPEVVTGAKQLLAYNIEAEKIIPTFKALGNIAAGVGKDKLPQLILAYGQVRAATKLTGAELRQFTEAGVPLLDALAKQFGTTAGAVQEMISEGKVGFPEVQKAIFGMSEEGGKFFNLMEKQSQTFGGMLSNLKDNFGRIGREIIGISDEGEVKKGGIFYYLTKGASGFLLWLDQNKQKIIDGFTSIVGGIKTLITGNFNPEDWPKAMGISEDSPIIDGLLTVRETFLTVFNFIKDIVVSSANGVSNALAFLAPSFSALWETIQNQLWPSLQNLYTSIEPLIPVIGMALVGAIWVLINGFNLVVKAISFVNNVAAGLYTFFFQTIPNAFKVGVDFIVEKITWLKDNFWETIGFIIGFFATLPIKIPFFIMGAIAKVISFLASINWGGVLSSIGRAFQNVWNSVWEGAKNIFNSLKNMKWGEILAGIGKGIGNGVIGLVEGAINGAISGIPGMGKIKLPRFAEGVQNFGGGMAIVGERGPEVVQLPRGSNVIPNHELGGKTEVNITIQAGAFMGSQSDARKLAMMVIEAAKDVAGSKNMSITEMLGA